MTATRSFRDVQNHPDFRAFVAARDRWVHVGPEGVASKGGDYRVESRFGSVESAVVIGPDGKLAFDRPLYREAANVNIVAYGLDANGKIRIAIIRQPRPHADDPEQPGNEHPPVVFGQIPAGFLERVIGKDSVERLETVEVGATRETSEETGATAVVRITRPAYPFVFPAPTFCATWSDLLFVEVDLERIEALKPDRTEPIFSAEYLLVPELLRRIREGKDETGAVYRAGVYLGDLMVFFATHPEWFCAG